MWKKTNDFFGACSVTEAMNELKLLLERSLRKVKGKRNVDKNKQILEEFKSIKHNICRIIQVI